MTQFTVGDEALLTAAKDAVTAWNALQWGCALVPDRRNEAARELRECLDRLRQVAAALAGQPA